MELEYCECEGNTGVYTDNEDFGFWYCCVECNKRIDGEFYYYDEPILY